MEAPSDPTRVLKGTAAHMRRLQQHEQERRRKEEEQAGGGGRRRDGGGAAGFILHVAHRQVPSWCAGVQR